MDPRPSSNQPGYASLRTPAQSIGEVPVEVVIKKNYLRRIFSKPIGRLAYLVGIIICSGVIWLISEIPNTLLKNNFILFPEIIIILLILLFEVGLIMRRLRDLHMPRALFFLAFVPVADVVLAGILFVKAGVKKEGEQVTKKNLPYLLKEVLAIDTWKDEPLENNQTDVTNTENTNQKSGNDDLLKYGSILFGVVILAMLIIWSPHIVSFFQNREGGNIKISSTPSPVACTMEAKQCQDGSYVSRKGPKCEFAPCPTLSLEIPADWKIYNKKYPYSLKYPPDWKVFEATDSSFIYPIGSDKLAELDKTAPSFAGHPGIGTMQGITIELISSTSAKNSMRRSANKIEKIKVDGIDGEYYGVPMAPISPIIFDLPISDFQVLRVMFINLDENINSLNKQFNMNVKIADEATFRKIISTIKLVKLPPTGP